MSDLLGTLVDTPLTQVMAVGFDVCSHRRIQASWSRFGPRLLRRIYTAHEIQRACLTRSGVIANSPDDVTELQCQRIVSRLSRLFAAKEAASKTLGTGIARGIGWQHLEVRHRKGGAPIMVLHGPALERARWLTRVDFPILRISLSSEEAMAYAIAVLGIPPSNQ